MKKDIHPNYVECTVTCGCGESFKTHATVKELRIEICSKCHPFFSGKQKFVDTAGRVDKFLKKYTKAEPAKR
jgi:large subunit ribosomal protein L31